MGAPALPAVPVLVTASEGSFASLWSFHYSGVVVGSAGQRSAATRLTQHGVEVMAKGGTMFAPAPAAVAIGGWVIAAADAIGGWVIATVSGEPSICVEFK